MSVGSNTPWNTKKKLMQTLKAIALRYAAYEMIFD